MKRKILLIAMIVVGIFSAAFGFAACQTAGDQSPNDNQNQNANQNGTQNGNQSGTQNGNQNQFEHIHNWDEGQITTNPTCITPGVITYTCDGCDSVRKEALDADGVSHVYGAYRLDDIAHWRTCNLCSYFLKEEHDFGDVSKESDVNEIMNCECGIHKTVGEFFAFKTVFECSDGTTVLVYNTQDYSDGGIASNVAYSRSKSGELLNDGEGQINFEIVVALGYKLKSIEAAPSSGYKNLKGSEETGVENIYRITKIESDLTVKIEVEVDALDLPVMVINTVDSKPVLDKENDVSCSVSVMNAEEKFCFSEVEAGIRGRGNSTWQEPKKPYRLKFSNKIDLFGNGKAKKWVLLADCYDASMIRNYITYGIATNLLDDLKYTTSTQHVELYLNGEYLGVYLLCEQHETGENRVNIDTSVIDNNGNPKYDTGYLLEMDVRAPSEGVENVDYFYVPGIKTPFAIKSPEIEDIEAAGLDVIDFIDFIRGRLTLCFDALSGDDYEAARNLIDVNSFLDGYIIDELVNLSDLDNASFFIYYDSVDQLIHRGPIWDYNGSIANATNTESAGGCNPENLYAKNILIYSYLLKFREFNDSLQMRLTDLRSGIEDYINDEIQGLKSMQASFDRNYTRWAQYIKQFQYIDEMAPLEGWTEHLEYVRTWLLRSLEYMVSVYCPENA